MKQKQFMIFKENNRNIRNGFFIYVLMFCMDHMQASNFFTQSFQNDQIQILPVHMDGPLTHQLNQWIWQKKFHKKNKIKLLRKQLPLRDWDGNEQLTKIHYSCGYYAFENQQLQLFFHQSHSNQSHDYHEDNKVTLNFIMEQSWVFDDKTWILIHKKKNVFHIILPHLAPINYNETPYYAIGFTPYAHQLNFREMSNNLELYQGSTTIHKKNFLDQWMNPWNQNHWWINFQFHWENFQDKLTDFMNKPLIRDHCLVWSVMIFEIYCMCLIYRI